MIKNRLMPEIRFEEFKDEWIDLKISDVVKVNSGRDYKHLKQGAVPVYGTGGYMLSVDEALSKQDAIGIGRKGTIDVPQKLTAPFWTVDTLFYLTPYENYDLSFMFSLMETVPWRSFEESTGVPSLSRKQIDNINIEIPDVNEQSKLGYYFEKLDNNMDLKKQELSKLKQIKQAMLQKLFPKEDKKIPEVRFDGFDDEWTESYLGEASKISGGFAFKSSDFTDNGNPIVRITNINSNGTLEGPFMYVNPDITPNNESILTSSEILVALSGATTGKAALNKNFNGYVNQRIGIIRDCNHADIDFLFSILEKQEFQNYVNSNVGAGAQPNISTNSLKRYKTFLPKFEEQRIIGRFLESLNQNIQSKQAELDKLKQFKQAMLDKMFV